MYTVRTWISRAPGRTALAAFVVAASMCAAAAGPDAAVASGPLAADAPPGAPARRVVTVAPALTELVAAAGGLDRLVGVDAASDHPAAVRALPRVADHRHYDLERIAALAPDLVVAWPDGTSPRAVAALHRLGVPVHEVHVRRLDEIADALEALGARLGTRDQAALAARAVRERLASIRARFAGRPPLRVFYQVWDRPVMTIGDTHPIADALAACGARKLPAGLASMAPVVGVESVLQVAPEVIVTAVAGGVARTDPFATWRRFARLPAVASDNLLVLDADRMSRATPRMLDGVEALCEGLDRFRARRPPAG